MTKLRFYFSLYKANMKRSMIGRMEYRNDFIIGIIGFLVQNVATLLSL